MKFQAAYSYLKRGHKIKLPEWGGFWEWDFEEKMIIINCRNGKVLRFTETEDLDYTMSFLFRDDWEVVNE